MREYYERTVIRLGRYLGTDMQYVVSGGFWVIFQQVFLVFLGFAATYVLTNFLPKEVFGQYRFMLTLVPLFALFSLTGVTAALTRSVARGELLNLKDIIRVRIGWGLLGSLVAVGVAVYYFLQGDSNLGFALLIVAASAPLMESFFDYVAYYRGARDFRSFGLVQVLGQAFVVTTLIVTVFLTDRLLPVLLVGLLSQVGVRFFFMLRLLLRQSSLQPDQQATYEVIQYGKRLSGTEVVTRLANEIDKLLLWHFLGAANLALYTVALAIPTALRGMAGFVVDLSLPKFSVAGWIDRPYTFFRSRKFIAYILLLLGMYGVYIFVSPLLFRWFFPHYVDGVGMTMILGSTVVLVSIRNLLDQIFIARKQVKKIFVYRIFEIVVYCVLFFLLLFGQGSHFMILSLVLPCKYVAVIILQFWLLRR